MARDSLSDSAPWFLADHAALDFINTVRQVDGQPLDFWQSDEDVAGWLHQADLPVAQTRVSKAPDQLLQEARCLRDIIREMVMQRKAGIEMKAEALNRYLAAATTYSKLMSAEDGTLRLERIYGGETAIQQLAPVAEQAASLLAEENFTLVRECEHPECSLWFYDRTKAHRRRWCSMAVCGNRAKVARFRQQKQC